MVELLARTGMRVGELAGLEDDAMIHKGDGHRLRIPIGKLHNDRHVPLHPMLVDLIGEYRAMRGPSRSGHLFERDDGHPSTGAPSTATWRRSPNERASATFIPPTAPHARHPVHQPGMSLEAIAALLGHRSMDMTLTYARISDETVADAYFKVTEAVEAQYYGRSGRHWRSRQRRAPRRRPVTIAGCSPTGTAPDPPSSTAPSRAFVSAAGSSKPDPSSSPS